MAEPALHVEEPPTESHALAQTEQDEKGAAQIGHDEPGINDIGWHEDPTKVASLVGGLPNEELWTLLRRFNKQMYHVKKISEPPIGGLDLNIADEEEFSPDKLRSNIERLYMTVLIGLIGFGKHIMRLRSWRERKRTAAFATVYFVAWAFDFIVPLLLLTLIVLTISPYSRELLFPPAPLALVSAKTGGIQKPKAGMLGSHDSMTGAPEKHQGEAVEQEASNFVSGFASIAISSASGKHPENPTQEEGGAIDTSVPDPTNLASGALDAKSSASGAVNEKKHDKTKQPVEDAIWLKARPVMHVIGDLSDGWERFGNALSPTPPFSRDAARVKLAGILAPIFLAALFISSYMVVKGLTFGIGVGLFGDPVTSRGLAWLNKNYPDWPKFLEIRNTILKGVPTNAQLTITLLRVGESNRAPLPPPPSSTAPPSSKPADLNHEDLALDASPAEVQDAIHPEGGDVNIAQGIDGDESKKKPKHGSKVLSFIKGSTRTGVGAILGTDRLKAKAGSEVSKNRLGVVPRPNEPAERGPVDFDARYHGKKGRAYISTSSTSPCIGFTDSMPKRGEPITPLWSVAIPEIREIRKVGGVGWKARLVIGWAMDREVADGLEITNSKGEKMVITAIRQRDELFNRLIAMGDQMWESW